LIEGIIRTFHLPVAAVAISALLSFGGFIFIPVKAYYILMSYENQIGLIDALRILGFVQ